MTRPFAVVGFTLLLSLLAASVFGTVPSLVLGGVLSLCFFLSFFMQKGTTRQYFLLVLCTFSAGLFLFTGYTYCRVAPVQKLADTTATVKGALAQPVSFNGSRYTYYLKTSQVSNSNAPQKIKVAVTAKERLDVKVSDTVETTVRFSDNSGSADYGAGYYIQGRSLGGSQVIEKETPSLYGKVMLLREKLANALRALLPGDEGAVIVAMVLGDRNGMNSQLKELFTESGVYHLFAVSGLHVSLWSALAFWALRKLRLGLKPAALLSAGITFFYMALTGFSMSVLRAGIMMILMLFGRAFLKIPDSVNSLGLAVGLLCLFQPMAVFSVSFLLTVFSCLGITTMGRSLCAKYAHVFERFRCKKIFTWLANSAFISVALMLFTLPVQMLCFQQIVPLSILSNLIFIPLGTCTIVCGGLAALCVGIPFLAAPMALFAGLGAKLMIFLASAIAEFPITGVGLGEPYLLLWLAGSMGLFGMGFLLRRNTSLVKLTALLCSMALAVTATGQFFLNRDLLEMHVLDVGDGTAVLFHYKDHTFLVGCGGEYRVSSGVNAILRQAHHKTLDLLIVPRFTQKESGRLAEITDAVPVKRVLLPDNTSGIMPKAEQISAQSDVTIAFDTALRVKYRYEENHYYVLVTFGDTQIVLTDSGAEALLSRDGVNKSPQILMTGSAMPDGVAGSLNFFSGDIYANEKAEVYRGAGSDVVVTGGNGGLYLKVNQNGSYIVRRETTWQLSAKQN